MLIVSSWGVWNLQQNRAVIEFPASVQAAAFSPDQCLLAAGTKDGQVWFWDLNTSRSLKPLAAHAGGVTDMAFSPDGRLLYTTSSDGSLVAWGLPNSLSLATTKPAEVRCVAPSSPLSTIAPTPTPTRTPTRTRTSTATRLYTTTPRP
jgi:WD40 repeat protein